MKTILLSIKPEYANKILDGTKKYEYRKRIARNLTDTLLIYSTAPEMKIVAEVEILNSLSAAPSILWEQTKNDAGISRKNIVHIFMGVKKRMLMSWGMWKYLILHVICLNIMLRYRHNLLYMLIQ